MTDAYPEEAFTLISPLGGLFLYYENDGSYYRRALDERARLTQTDEVKKIPKMVFEHAQRIKLREA